MKPKFQIRMYKYETGTLVMIQTLETRGLSKREDNGRERKDYEGGTERRVRSNRNARKTGWDCKGVLQSADKDITNFCAELVPKVEGLRKKPGYERATESETRDSV